jgi:hypothetical protein
MTTDDKRYYMHQCDWVDDIITTDQMIAEIKRMADDQWLTGFVEARDFKSAFAYELIQNGGLYPDYWVADLYNTMHKTLELGRDGS